MKRYMGIAVFLLSGLAQASVGVVLGANEWADDGMPQLAADETVKVFYCHAKNIDMDGPMAESCALEKCKRHFKIPFMTKEQQFANGIIGGHCKRDGWSERRFAHNVAATGDSGDNRFMFSKALGDPTREEAMKWLGDNDFPVKAANMVFDFLDTGTNGQETFESAFPELFRQSGNPKARGISEDRENVSKGRDFMSRQKRLD